MNQSKLGRTEIVFAAAGLVAIVASFLPWLTVSMKGLGELFGGKGGGSISGNAWDSGIGAWFPMLLLFAVGVVAVLPAAGVNIKLPGGLPLVGAAAGVLGTVIVLLRWLTFDGKGLADVSAGYGLYVGLVAAIVVAAFGYLGFAASGGSFSTIGQAFSEKPAAPSAGDQL